MLLKEIHLTESKMYDLVFLHGGPANLEGGRLKRGGRGGHDMGALFFVPESKDGYKYAMGYAIARSPKDWAIYRVRLNLPDNRIFNFTNPQHQELAKRRLNAEEYNSWKSSVGTSGHLDWTKVDDELLEDWGFDAALFHERAKNVLGTNNDIVSVGVFNPKHIQILETLPKEVVKQKMPEIYG